MIRPATITDIPRLLVLGEAMHRESPKFSAAAWSAGKVGELLESLILDPDGLVLVAEVDGELVGGFLGVISEHFFSHDRFAQDFALFVASDRRGAYAGKRLLEGFKAWAQAKGVPAELGISTMVNVEQTGRLFEACGFERYGYLYREAAR